jgi:hypothetical protein
LAQQNPLRAAKCFERALAVALLIHCTLRISNLRAINLSTDLSWAGGTRQQAAVERKIAGILSAVEQGMFHPSMKERLSGLEAERAKLTHVELSALSAAVSSRPIWQKPTVVRCRNWNS